MNWLCTMSGDRYHNTTERIVRDAPRFGVDQVLVYDDWWLRTKRHAYCVEQAWLFAHPRVRGINWFHFKPFLLMDALARIPDGDVMLYVDGDTFPIHDLRVLYDTCRKEEGVMMFSAVGFKQFQWVKRDAWILTGHDDPKWYDLQHGVARFMLFQKGAPKADRFLKDWYQYCSLKDSITFDASVLGPELPGFVQHRCEQALMSIVAHKYGHKMYREACQFGNGAPEDKDLYPQLFFQDGSHSYGSNRGQSDFRNVND